MLCACMSCKVRHIFNKTMSLLYIHLYTHIIIPLTQDGATPLYIASEKGHRDIVNILIRNGADINLARNVWRYNVPYTHTV